MSHEDTDDEDYDEDAECEVGEGEDEDTPEPFRCRVGLADGLFWTAALRGFDGWGALYFDATDCDPRTELPHLAAMLGFAASRGIMARA